MPPKPSITTHLGTHQQKIYGYLRKWDRASAIRYLQNVVFKDPNISHSFNVALLAVDVYRACGEYQAALHQLTQIKDHQLRDENQKIRYTTELARIYMLQGEHSQAQKKLFPHAQKAIADIKIKKRIDYLYKILLKTYATILNYLRDPQTQVIEELLIQYDGGEEIFIFRAKAQSYREDSSEIILSGINQGLALYPQSDDLMIRKIYLLIHVCELEEDDHARLAKNLIQELEQKDNFDIHVGLAKAMYEKRFGRIHKAVETLELYHSKLTGIDRISFEYLAMWYRQCGRIEEAVATYQKLDDHGLLLNIYCLCYVIALNKLAEKYRKKNQLNQFHLYCQRALDKINLLLNALEKCIDADFEDYSDDIYIDKEATDKNKLYFDAMIVKGIVLKSMGKIKDSNQVFKEILIKNQRIYQACYNIILNYFFSYEDYASVVEWVNNLKDKLIFRSNLTISERKYYVRIYAVYAMAFYNLSPNDNLSHARAIVDDLHPICDDEVLESITEKLNAAARDGFPLVKMHPISAYQKAMRLNSKRFNDNHPLDHEKESLNKLKIETKEEKPPESRDEKDNDEELLYIANLQDLLDELLFYFKKPFFQGISKRDQIEKQLDDLEKNIKRNERRKAFKILEDLCKVFLPFVYSACLKIMFNLSEYTNPMHAKGSKSLNFNLQKLQSVNNSLESLNECNDDFKKIDNLEYLFDYLNDLLHGYWKAWQELSQLSDFFQPKPVVDRPATPLTNPQSPKLNIKNQDQLNGNNHNSVCTVNITKPLPSRNQEQILKAESDLQPSLKEHKIEPTIKPSDIPTRPSKAELNNNEEPLTCDIKKKQNKKHKRKKKKKLKDPSTGQNKSAFWQAGHHITSTQLNLGSDHSNFRI